VARHVLVTVLSLLPRRSDTPPPPACPMPCGLRPDRAGSTAGVCFLTRPPLGAPALRPGDSLTLPKRALSIGCIRFVSSTETIHATGLLTLPPVGRTPTDHASLR
jgi:hypothetical protein